jgi:putative Mg2+ transporter-C (MgtC) family protein
MMEGYPEWAVQLQAFDWSSAGKIILAAVLGGLIGIEREYHGRTAGLRTNIMIAIASCLFTILSIDGFPLKGSAQDTGRIAAQIVTGVGFLGAGALLHNKNKVRGLTTAATIWLVAAVGMAVGAGAYFLAVFTAVLAAAVLELLRPLSQQLKEQRAPHPPPTNRPNARTARKREPPER